MTQYNSFKEVIQRYRASRSSIYRWVSDPAVGFPEPVKIGHRVLWRDSDLDAFDARLAQPGCAKQ